MTFMMIFIIWAAINVSFVALRLFVTRDVQS